MLDEFSGKSRYKKIKDEEYEYEEFILSNLEDEEFLNELEYDCFEDEEVPF
jgi:hypothetical protein